MSEVLPASGLGVDPGGRAVEEPQEDGRREVVQGPGLPGVALVDENLKKKVKNLNLRQRLWHSGKAHSW